MRDMYGIIHYSANYSMILFNKIDKTVFLSLAYFKRWTDFGLCDALQTLEVVQKDYYGCSRNLLFDIVSITI